jgi:hypothetical protein
MGRTLTADVRAPATGSVRASAWDEVARGELAFDFGGRQSVKARPGGLAWRMRRTLRDRIARWLEEQL